jgi:hypothetical protein
VNVLTPNGQTIGTVRFNVVEVSEKVEMAEKIKE